MDQKPGGERLDSLTGVLMRNAAEARIAAGMRERPGGTLFLCEVEGIRRINERRGYLAGDDCLRRAARLLSYMIRPEDILGRRSGAQFVIFMWDCGDAKLAGASAERIRNRFRADGEKEGGKLPLSLTIVWTLREEGSTCGTLLARADGELARRRAGLEAAEDRNRRRKDRWAEDIRQVRRELLEQIRKPGAYCQDYEMFKAIYRFLARGIIRSGQKACVILLTLVSREGESPRLQEKDALMERLGEYIGDALRVGDVYARYSSCQYLLLVINTTKSQADLIAGRIREKFLSGGDDNDVLIHHCYDLEPAHMAEAGAEPGR